MTSSYVFVLGRTPNLAFAEISHLIPEAKGTFLTEHALLVEDIDIDPQHYIELLGGTVTIAQVQSVISEISAASIAEHMIAAVSGTSLTFALSSLGEFKVSEALLSQIKKELASKGISTRYVVNSSEHTLSAIVVKGQRVQEFILIPQNDTVLFTKTLAVQTIPSWVKREYDRPHADPKRGMLPPKVARMLVNIVSADTQGIEQKRLLDPFCGMGTILAEAMLRGWNVVGSDISESVVKNATENLSWLQEQYPTTKASAYECFMSDAVHVSQRIPGESIHAIVTEPFLGSPTFATKKVIDTTEVKNTIKGLEKLYIGALKDWHTILAPSGIILIAFPEFSVNGRELFVKKVIDSCETLGYSIEEGPYPYGRPGATVKRLFYLLRKT